MCEHVVFEVGRPLELPLTAFVGTGEWRLAGGPLLVRHLVVAVHGRVQKLVATVVYVAHKHLLLLF